MENHPAPGPSRPSVLPIDDRALFINRELSWLEFNEAVLTEAADGRVPLLERLKFLSIAQTNLEEFFMVRVGGLQEQVLEGVRNAPADGMTAEEQLSAISKRVMKMETRISSIFSQQIAPLFEENGVALRRPEDLSKEEQRRLRAYFQDHIFPILTPLALDPGHPFPHIPNKRLNLIISLVGEDDAAPAFAILQVPAVLPRLIPVDGDGEKATFVLLGDLVADNVHELFRGFRTCEAWPFRVIRNYDLSIDEEEAEDLLETIGEEVRRRDRGRAVALEVSSRCAPEAVSMLQSALDVRSEFVFDIDAPLAVQELLGLAEPLKDREELSDPPHTPQPSPAFSGEDPFETIRNGDVLLHHPYESFEPVVELLERAANDPDVLAIKQTLYRTSGDSPIVKALIRAAENGKQVAALVEIKARFDEENNIQWAQHLERSGVHVVYGLVGLKTHCKVMLIVRKEGHRLRRYVHLGTGNYNPKTATLYTDLSLFTARDDFGRDATSLFNLLTSCTPPTEWHELVIAPLGLHETTLGLIEREAAFARAGKPARIIAKMNSLQDPDVIRALYRASQAGVKVDLIVRGLCCLRPGLEGVSDNIRVVSVVDRFLEHHRIYFFEAGGRRLVYGASADWMSRNFHRRVEAMFPIVDEKIRRRVIEEVLENALLDTAKARELQSDGTYVRMRSEDDEETSLRRSQSLLVKLAKRAVKEAKERERAERPFIVRPIRHRPTKENPAAQVAIETGPEETS